MSISHDGDPKEARINDFLRLYNTNYHKLFLYTKSLVPFMDAVEDVLQEASLTLWSKYDEYNPSFPFYGWAIGIIKIKVLQWRREKWKEKRFLNDEFIDFISEKLVSKIESSNERVDALQRCFNRLTIRKQEIIEDRYRRNLEISEIARKNRKSEQAVYQTLCRIRHALRRCVNEMLGKNG